MRTTLLAASFLRASSLLLVVQAFVPQQLHQVPGRTSLSFAPQILYSPVKSVGLCMSSSSNEVENEKASDVAELSNDANGLSSHAHAADVNGATLGDIETSSSSTQMNGDTTNGVVTNGDATSVAKDEEPSSEPYQPRTVNVNLDLDIDNEVFEGISQKLREDVVGPMFGPDIEKAVPGDTLKGAALLGIGLSALIGNDVVLSSALGLVSAYVAIQPGPFGNFFRTAGKTTWSTLTGVGGLFKRIVTNNKVTAVTKGLLSSRNKGGSSSKDIDNVIAETEALLKEVDNDVSIPYDAPARLAYHTMYANDGTGFDHVKFEKFKKQYVKNAIADVIRKRGGTVPEDDEDDDSPSEVMVDVSVPYDAPARLAYDKMYPNEAFNQAKFEAFKLEYVENAIAQVVQKTMQERVVSAEKAEQERQQKAEAEAKAAAEEEARMVEEMARLAAEEEAARLAAEQAEADLVAEQARLQAEEEEAARVKAEEAKLAEEARLAAEEINEEDEDRIDKDDWDASIKLAQQLAEDTIAGVDIGTMNLEDGPTSSSSSTAAPAKADTDDGVDMEELGRLAREAVEAFEAQYEMEEEQMQDEKKAWNENMQQTSAAPSTESKTDWKKLTVVKLKEELKSRGLTPKGKKADLVAMLEEYEAAPAADLVSDAQEVLAESQEVFAKMDQANDEIEQMLMLMNDDILDATEPSDADLAELAATAEEIYAPSSGGGDPFAGEDMEAIARAAREAVQKFEADNGDGEYVIEQQQQDGGNQTWEEMSVVELKDELRNRGLRVGGRKAELIERLKKAEEA